MSAMSENLEVSERHIEALEKQINALSDALAKLGQGSTFPEMLKIIRFPGYTTPAEFAFLQAILNGIDSHRASIESLQAAMLSASKLVGPMRTMGGGSWNG